jgi:hypothetical protein
MSHKKYKGTCFCGAVKIEATGAPVLMGYCHCESCRQWAAAPVNAFTLWQPDAVKITAGKEHVGTYAKTPKSMRKWCKQCGGHLMTDHPAMGLVDVYAAILPELKFVAGQHVFYAETVLRMPDQVPKQKDLPKEAGGSGVTLPS